MLPGLWPTMIMGGPPRLYDVSITPAPGNWFGVAMNYSTSMSIVHSGGTAPFTYTWNSDSGVSIADPTLQTIDLTSTNGPAVSLSCTVLDAAGQIAFATGNILSVSGGGGS